MADPYFFESSKIEFLLGLLVDELRDKTGRYIVSLPFKAIALPEFGCTSMQYKRFYNLEKRLQKDSLLYQKYRDFMSEYIAMGHIKPEGCSYKDMLSGVKNVIGKLNTDSEIQTVRKTREGHLLMTLKKDNPQNSVLLTAIVKQMPTATAKLKVNEADITILHINNIDATTTVEDIHSGIKL